MNEDENKVWAWANTGTKAHAFVQSAGLGRLRAMCRSNIERGTNAQFADKDNHNVSFALCTRCVTLFDAMTDRAEASMAPTQDVDPQTYAEHFTPQAAEGKSDEAEQLTACAGRPLPKLVPGDPRPAFGQDPVDESVSRTVHAAETVAEAEMTAAERVAEAAVEEAVAVAEANGCTAVWMVVHRGAQMWAAKDAPGLYTSKDRAQAAQQRAGHVAATVRHALGLDW